VASEKRDESKREETGGEPSLGAVSRREILKFGAGSAALAGLAGIRLVQPAPASAQDCPEPEPSLGFAVRIEGAPAASGAVREVEISPLRLSPRRGEVRGAPIEATLKTAGSPEGTKELQSWFEECAKGKNIRKSISVICLRRDGSPARTYNLFDCFPTQWSSVNFDTSSTVQTETLTVKIGRIEFKT
jgi:hypothetical protein